jgi:hypothetical protein
VKKIAGNFFREKLFQRNYVFGKFYFNISKFRSCVIHICSKSDQFYHAQCHALLCREGALLPYQIHSIFIGITYPDISEHPQ